MMNLVTRVDCIHC